MRYKISLKIHPNEAPWYCSMIPRPHSDGLLLQRCTPYFSTSPYRSSVVCHQVFLNDAGSYIVTVRNNGW